ncbi:MAG: lipocalin family protein [Gemmatimonadota bacterium]
MRTIWKFGARKFAVAAIALSLVAVGCSDSDGGPNGPDPDPLIGTWSATSILADGTEIQVGGLTLTITFGDDGMFATSTTNDADGIFCEGATSCTDEGAFTFTSTQLTFDVGSVDEAILNYTITGNTLTVSGDIDGTAMVMTFTRQ